MALDIEVEALVGTEVERAEEHLELDCHFAPHAASGLVLITFDDIDYDPVRPWDNYLFDLGFQDNYSYQVHSEFNRAFSAHLYFDAEHPDVLFETPSGARGQSYVESLDAPPTEPDGSL